MTTLHILSVKTQRVNAQRNLEIYLCSNCALSAQPGNMHHEEGTALNQRGYVLSLQRPSLSWMDKIDEFHSPSDCQSCDGHHHFEKPTPEEAVEIKCEEIYNLFEDEMKNSHFTSSGMIQTLTLELARKMSAYLTVLRRNETPR